MPKTMRRLRRATTNPLNTPDLNTQEKAAIAAVLSWDLCKPIQPDEVESIRVRGEWFQIRLSCDRAVPIHRDVFRTIRQQQMAQAN